jgi:hypothetical protein
MKMQTKLYVFVNSWLSSIQKGIQASHLVHKFWAEDLDSVYEKDSLPYVITPKNLLINWVKDSQKIIILEGGSAKNLKNIWNILDNKIIRSLFPIANFHEDDSLNGCMTATGIILPDNRTTFSSILYSVDDDYRIKRESRHLIEEILLKKTYPLAD